MLPGSGTRAWRGAGRCRPGPKTIRIATSRKKPGPPHEDVPLTSVHTRSDSRGRRDDEGADEEPGDGRRRATGQPRRRGAPAAPRGRSRRRPGGSGPDACSGTGTGSGVGSLVSSKMVVGAVAGSGLGVRRLSRLGRLGAGAAAGATGAGAAGVGATTGSAGAGRCFFLRPNSDGGSSEGASVSRSSAMTVSLSDPPAPPQAPRRP